MTTIFCDFHKPTESLIPKSLPILLSHANGDWLCHPDSNDTTPLNWSSKNLSQVTTLATHTTAPN